MFLESQWLEDVVPIERLFLFRAHVSFWGCITIFNRKYIFIQGPFSIAMLVYPIHDAIHILTLKCQGRISSKKF